VGLSADKNPILDYISKVTGKTVQYNQISLACNDEYGKPGKNPILPDDLAATYMSSLVMAVHQYEYFSYGGQGFCLPIFFRGGHFSLYMH